MAFSDPADRGIAGHLSQGVEAMGQEEGLAPDAGGRERGLGAGMPATHYNNIIFIKYLHDIFGARVIRMIPENR
jgi:hypothetical protein